MDASIVLVHGGFVDGSGWEGVYKILTKDGYTVGVVQNATKSLADDVATTKQVIAAQKAPVILVGHSYGGAVITEAGTDPKVIALVYITAFAPDKGESVESLIKDPPPGSAGAPDPAAGERIPLPRPREVPGIVRGRRWKGAGPVHGRLAGAVGSRGVGRENHRSRVEAQAELVPPRY